MLGFTFRVGDRPGVGDRGVSAAGSAFHELIGEDEHRALTPLFWSNINPYGRFRLDMNTRLDLAGGAQTTESVL